MNQIDALERAVELKLYRADCCVQCDKLIPSETQIRRKGAQFCDECVMKLSLREQNKQGY